MSNIQIVLQLIVLQQGLCAVAWWVGGWWLGLPKATAAHWLVGTLCAAVGLCLILLRGVLPGFLTLIVANLLILTTFIAMRRGIQTFLHLKVTDGEHLALLGLDALLLQDFMAGPGHAAIAVIGVSVPIAWTLLRAAHECHEALQREVSSTTAHAASIPLALLGLLFTLRVVAGVVMPGVAALPLNEPNSFNAGVALMVMLGGLIVNLVLALLVVGRLVNRLQQLSERDWLTGLMNRRAFTPLLQREAGHLRRFGGAYAVLMIDADHFKALNDHHGHAAGDATLVRLAHVLREAAREVDCVARVGGEEFCILLPSADRSGAMALAGRVLAAVRSAHWEAPAQPVTVSVGVAVTHSADEPAQTVVERADRALYRAKHEGRDRFVLDAPEMHGSLAVLARLA